MLSRALLQCVSHGSRAAVCTFCAVEASPICWGVGRGIALQAAIPSIALLGARLVTVPIVAGPPRSHLLPLQHVESFMLSFYTSRMCLRTRKCGFREPLQMSITKSSSQTQQFSTRNHLPGCCAHRDVLIGQEPSGTGFP